MMHSGDSLVRKRVVCFILFCVSLALSAYSAKNEWIQRSGWKIIAYVLSPLENSLVTASGAVTNVWDSYVWLVETKKENDLLKEKVMGLESENSLLLERTSEIGRLRKILNAKEEIQLEGVVADVIAFDPTNWRQVVTINRGSRDGVIQGSAVIHGSSLVGQVTHVGERTSQVILITDRSSGVDALIQSSRVRGVLEGLGRDGCSLNFISQRDEIRPGDRVITSGMDGVFPKGLLIGRVSEVSESTGMFRSIIVKPAVHFGKLETILVVKPQN